MAGGYLAQTDMRRLITAALELGWTLWAYDDEPVPGTSQAEMLTMEYTNWREREQARNLRRLRALAPGEPLLVWCGNGHARKEAGREWVPVGFYARLKKCGDLACTGRPFTGHRNVPC